MGISAFGSRGMGSLRSGNGEATYPWFLNRKQLQILANEKALIWSAAVQTLHAVVADFAEQPTTHGGGKKRKSANSSVAQDLRAG